VARLLLVEDDPSIAEPLVAALRREGHEVAWSPTGVDGLASVGPEVDLVLLDLGLPDVDGLEVCRQLRKRLPDLPVLMLTARAEEVDAVVGLDAGADDYVTKPFRLAELMARIRAASAGRRRVRQKSPQFKTSASTTPPAGPGGATRSSSCRPRSSISWPCWPATPAGR